MKNTDKKSEAALLRQKAEKQLKKKAAKTVSKLSEVEILKLVHELELHKIELEMMNAQLLENSKNEKIISAELLVTHEELNRAHLKEAELAENKYMKLYDFAPVGYFTLSTEGEILQTNLIGAAMLGKERFQLLNARFGFFVSDETKQVFNEFLDKVFSNNVKQLCDVTLVRNSKERLTVQCIGISNKKSGECFVSAVDITERIKAEETSRANEIRYRTLYTKAIDGIMFLSLDSKIANVNESFAKMHGYTVDEMQKMSLKDLDTPETSRGVSERISRISSGETIIFEVEHYHKDGHIIVLEVSASLVSIGTERIIQTFHRDITERKYAENELRESDARYTSMTSNISDVIGIMGADGIMTYKSPNIEKMFGWLPQDRVGTSGFSTIHPDDMERVGKVFYSLLEKDRSVITLEFRYQCKDGSYKPVELTAANMLNDPFIHGVLLNYRDITERKNAEEVLKNEHLRLQGIIEGTNAGTWEWNIQTGEVVFNQKWAEIVGYMPEELAPVSITTWETLTHPDDLKRSAVLLEQHFKGELLYYTCECRMKHKDGSWIWIMDRGRVITRSADGKPLMMFGIHSDITQRKYDEEERVRLIAELQSALAEVKTLTGIIPICANCKKIRDDKGYWDQVETYVSHHTSAQFSHSICPDCVEKIYPDMQRECGTNRNNKVIGSGHPNYVTRQRASVDDGT